MTRMARFKTTKISAFDALSDEQVRDRTRRGKEFNHSTPGVNEDETTQG